MSNSWSSDAGYLSVPLQNKLLAVFLNMGSKVLRNPDIERWSEHYGDPYF